MNVQKMGAVYCTSLNISNYSPVVPKKNQSNVALFD